MEYSNLEIARGLARLDHRVEVVARWNPGIETLASRLNFPVRVLPGFPGAPAHSIVRKGRWNWLLWTRYRSILSRRMDRFRPDAILVADETANAFWGSFPERRRIPYVAYCSVPYVSLRKAPPGRFGLLGRVKRGLESRISDRFRKWMLRSYRDASKMGVVSRSTFRLLADAAPDLEPKMAVVPRSVDDVFFGARTFPGRIAELRREFGIAERERVLLAVTNLLREKGVDDVLFGISMLPEAERRNLRFLIVGGGPDCERLARLSASLTGVGSRAVFVGPRPHSTLPEIYDLCDLFVLPSRRGEAESFGRVFAEAAARSKPAVGVAAGGMPDVIRNGETGFLVSAGDRDALSGIFRRLLAEPSWFRDMGRRARERAVARFASASVAWSMSALLDSARKSNGRPRVST